MSAVKVRKGPGRPPMFNGRRDATMPPFQTFPEVQAAAQRMRAETGLSLAMIQHQALVKFLKAAGYLKPSANGSQGGD